MIPHIKSSDVVTYVDKDYTPKQFSTNHPKYAELMEIINSPATLSAYEKLENILEPRTLFEGVHTDGIVTLEFTGSALVCKVEDEEYRLNNALVNAAIAMATEHQDMGPLLKFIYKLSQNPSKDVSHQLWDFITACGLCLTPEGNFLAYKNVNTDFTSAYDGKTDNTPGTVLKMIRTNVDHNPDRTCSKGLHFAAWGYLSSYASGRKTVILSISPADVVSIPTDYNNQKGRACRYKVIREVRQPEELKNITLYEEGDDSFDEEDYY